MSKKVLIITENNTMKTALAFELSSMGFELASKISEVNGNDIIVSDDVSNELYYGITEKVLYILPQGSDESGFGGKKKLIRPLSIPDFKRTVLELAGGYSAPSQNMKNDDCLSIQISDNCIAFNGKRIELTKNEMLIFSELWHNKGKAVSRERLDEITGANRDGNMVTVYINRLREKLSAVSDKRIIRTIRGSGYTVSDK